MTRKPVVAGMFYPGNFSDLDKIINWCFEESKFGPACLPSNKRTKKIIGGVCPHAGYPYSGPAAAWVFKEIAESEFPDLFIILGTSHSGSTSCISLEDWETPFGLVKVNKAFGERFAKKSGLIVNEAAHSNEHSIEVQLPFLQFVNKDKLTLIRILPILVSHDVDPTGIAEAIAETIKETKKKVIIIASGDFTHYGLNYGYMPFRDNVKENLHKLDKGAIEFIRKLDTSGFRDYINKTGATICGRDSISVLIETMKVLMAKKAKLLHYYTSGDIVGDYSNAVGYGAIVFE